MLSDSKFIQLGIEQNQATNKFNQKTVDKESLKHIASEEDWALHQAERLINQPQPTNGSYKVGDEVQFVAGDGTVYTGKVASRSGKDYIVEITAGESYLVPEQKLESVRERNALRAAVLEETTPPIDILSEPIMVSDNRFVMKIGFRGRRPSDDQVAHWAYNKFAGWKFVDAEIQPNNQFNLVFEAAADPMPQGGDQVNRGRALSSEEMEGSGVVAESMEEPAEQQEHSAIDRLDEAIDELEEIHSELEDAEQMEMSAGKKSKTFKLKDVVKKESQAKGQPGYFDQFQDLDKAANWVLSRFNDNNPSVFAEPGSVDTDNAGDFKTLRLSFTLHQRDDNDQLTGMFMSKSGVLVTSEQGRGMDNASGYVQVDSEGSLPLFMLNGPGGPQPIQEFGFKVTSRRLANYDSCKMAADEVLAQYGGYSAEAQADFDARLIKLGVDDETKKYWGSYFGQYGKSLTKDIPNRQAMKKTAIDQLAKDYWAQYWGEYGALLTKDVKRRNYGPDGVTGGGRKYDSVTQKEPTEPTAEEPKDTTEEKPAEEPKEDNKPDFLKGKKEAKVVKEDGKYCVKSEDNKDWSGGCYPSKEKAKKRLQQVEMFKHMSKQMCADDGIELSDEQIDKIANLTVDSLELTIDEFSRVAQRNDDITDIRNILKHVVTMAAEDESMQKLLGGIIANWYMKNPQALYNEIDPKMKARILDEAVTSSPKILNQLSKVMHRDVKRRQKQRLRSQNPSLLDRAIDKGKELFSGPGKTEPQSVRPESGEPAWSRQSLPATDEELFGKGKPSKKPESDEPEEPAVSEEFEKPEKEPPVQDQPIDLGKPKEKPAPAKEEPKSEPSAPQSMGGQEHKTETGWPKGTEEFAEPAEEKKEEPRRPIDKPVIQDKKKKLEQMLQHKIPSGEFKGMTMGEALQYEEGQKYIKDFYMPKFPDEQKAQMIELMKSQAPTKSLEPKKTKTPVEKKPVEKKTKSEGGEAKPKAPAKSPLPVKKPEEVPKPTEAVDPSKDLSNYVITEGQFKGKKVKDIMPNNNAVVPLFNYLKNKFGDDVAVMDQLKELIHNQNEKVKSLKQEKEMQRTSGVGPGPTAYNSPGKDDTKDYDHKEMNIQPPKSRTRFEITRMYSTTASDDNGYIIMDIAWEPKDMKGMHPSNVQHQIVSFVKGLESDKYFHDFGVLGKPKFMEFDSDAGLAKVKVRSSETRNVVTLTQSVEMDEAKPIPVSGLR